MHRNNSCIWFLFNLQRKNIQCYTVCIQGVIYKNMRGIVCLLSIKHLSEVVTSFTRMRNPVHSPGPCVAILLHVNDASSTPSPECQQTCPSFVHIHVIQEQAKNGIVTSSIAFGLIQGLVVTVSSSRINT
jgi:hypothetical protein